MHWTSDCYAVASVMKVRIAFCLQQQPYYIGESNAARCRDGEARIQHASKLANVDLGCQNVMAYPSLFLYVFHWLVFPCRYLIGVPPLHLYWFWWNIYTAQVLVNIVQSIYVACDFKTDFLKGEVFHAAFRWLLQHRRTGYITFLWKGHHWQLPQLRCCPMAAFSKVLTLLSRKSKRTAAEQGNQLQPIRYAKCPQQRNSSRLGFRSEIIIVNSELTALE